MVFEIVGGNKPQNNTKQGNKYSKNPIDKTSFLRSVNEFHPQGVVVEITSVKKIFENEMKDNQPTFFVHFRIISEMEKCYCWEVGENGEYKRRMNEIGEPIKILKTMEGTNQTFSIPFELRYAKTWDEDGVEHIDKSKYYVNNKLFSYPLIRFGLGDKLPNDFCGELRFDYDEIKNLEGLEFIVYSKKVEQKSFRTFYRFLPIPQGVELEEYKKFIRNWYCEKIPRINDGDF